MRIKELAELAGTTVRTVRYYHQTGLLPVPPDRFGRRDYELVHVARLIRIRWLTQAGVPLSKIAGMLTPPPAPPGEADDTARTSILLDLGATVVSLDEQLDRLQEQRDRVQRLIASVEDGEHLSPMPAAMARFYDDLAHRTEDENVRRTIRRERDFVELAFYRGDMPSGTEALYEGFDDTRRAESLALFGQVTDQLDPDHPPTEAQINQVVEAVIDRIRRHLGSEYPRVVREMDVDVARRAADLFVRVSEQHGRQVSRAIADALIIALEKEHSDV